MLNQPNKNEDHMIFQEMCMEAIKLQVRLAEIKAQIDNATQMTLLKGSDLAFNSRYNPIRFSIWKRLYLFWRLTKETH